MKNDKRRSQVNQKTMTNFRTYGSTPYGIAVIHGDHDPHPAEGVKKVFEENQKQFEFVLLKNCGHYPWMERQAHEKFYEVLKKEIR
ncbi:MAG: hypothetical protein ACD_62C00001G0007 [uncultured bacterium]|nr:MAG: hypothetical protein ACD_62C00001G0007 [uncultured bacterium]